MHKKIVTLSEIESLLEKYRKVNKKIIQCHGVFDLLHPGHVHHFHESKKQGDVLVVTVTSDSFVNKGPGRPVFKESYRMESIAALECVDFVILSKSSDAKSAISKIKPDVFVKGKEYKNFQEDITGKIKKEEEEVKKYSGRVYFTTDPVVFSSSSILNRYFDPLPKGVQSFINTIKKQYDCKNLIQKIDQLSDLKVLVIGDAILDQYQYVNPLGQSGKGLHMVVSCLDDELFLGGALIIANHIAQFTPNVTLLTGIGKNCSYQTWIQQKLSKNVNPIFFRTKHEETLIKKRYVLKDGGSLSKLFETYSFHTPLFGDKKVDSLSKCLKDASKEYDLVLVCDFGNGFMHQKLVETVSNLPQTVAVNTQLNSGNRGYNSITKYEKADIISLNELEIRLAAHDQIGLLLPIMKKIKDQMHCRHLSITRGVEGVICFAGKDQKIIVPSLSINALDRVGAGDSYFALSSLCLAKQYPSDLSGFIGAIAAGIDVQIVGNRDPVRKTSLCKYLTRLMK